MPCSADAAPVAGVAVPARHAETVNAEQARLCCGLPGAKACPRGTVTLRVYNPIACFALMLALGALLAACERPADVTARPPESTEPILVETAPAAIYVSAPVDLGKTEDEIVRLLPGDIAQIARRLPRAACQTNGTKKVCLDARLWGRITRDGQAKISATGQGLELNIPLRYELSVQPIGAGPATLISGALVVTASYALTMDERWQASLKLGQGYTWPQGAKIKVLDGETSVQSDVETVLTQKLAKLSPAAVAGLVPERLRAEVDLVWRYLHYPVALSLDRQIWMRGTPVGLRAGGFAKAAGGIELRMAIAAKIQTYVGDRPAPLPPSPMLPLGAGAEPGGGGVLLPADISYQAMADDAAKRLPNVPALAGEVKGAQAKVTGLSFYPSGKRLAVGVRFGLPANGGWFGSEGVAYYLATPALKAGSPEIQLGQCEAFGSSAKQSARQKELPFLLDQRFVDGLGAAVAVNIDDKLTSALDLMRQTQSVALGKGLKLWLAPNRARIVKIAPGAEGLRLQIEVTGDFTARRDGTYVASDGNGAKATP